MKIDIKIYIKLQWVSQNLLALSIFTETVIDVLRENKIGLDEQTPFGLLQNLIAYLENFLSR